MSRNELGNTVIFGGQAGSEGKGAIVGYLARKYEWAAAICSFMTNAGHTWVGNSGMKVVVQQLPMAVVNPEIPFLLIGPGSAITLTQLWSELYALDMQGLNASGRLRIHPKAMIIEHEDAEYEHRETRYLGSTAKGCGRAVARKAMRSKDVRLARDVRALAPFIVDTTMLVNTIMDNGNHVLIEGSQGFDLDLNHGIEYPYCTSRGTTPAATLADCGIATSRIQNTIATIRSYPIRVGNIVEDGKQIGYSGPMGGEELTWQQITERSGSPVGLEERTTVTKRVRRIFEIDIERLKYMVQVTKPTMMALTFADYIDHRIHDVTTYDFKTKLNWTLPRPVDRFVARIEDTLNVPIDLIKTGEKDGSIIDAIGINPVTSHPTIL